LAAKICGFFSTGRVLCRLNPFRCAVNCLCICVIRPTQLKKIHYPA
jgi:hypothetical protein